QLVARRRIARRDVEVAEPGEAAALAEQEQPGEESASHQNDPPRLKPVNEGPTIGASCRSADSCSGAPPQSVRKASTTAVTANTPAVAKSTSATSAKVSMSLCAAKSAPPSCRSTGSASCASTSP